MIVFDQALPKEKACLGGAQILERNSDFAFKKS